MNFLITNDGVICPQFGDDNDILALAQLKGIFQDKNVVGVYSKEVIYGGGNIHCITQQQPMYEKGRKGYNEKNKRYNTKTRWI